MLTSVTGFSNPFNSGGGEGPSSCGPVRRSRRAERMAHAIRTIASTFPAEQIRYVFSNFPENLADNSRTEPTVSFARSVTPAPHLAQKKERRLIQLSQHLPFDVTGYIIIRSNHKRPASIGR